MGNYVGKVGGSKWSQLVALQQQRNREVLKGLEKLQGVASTDATRLVIANAQCELLKNQAELVEMQLIAKNG